MTVLGHVHNPMVAFYQISRASRRKRRSCQESRFATIAYPTRGREHEREIPHHRKFGVDAWNEMVQKKIVAISFEEGVVFRVEDQLFKIASSCHNAWTGCNIMILKHFPLSPTPLSSLLSRTCRGTDKLGTPTCHHPWIVSRAGVRAYTFVRVLIFVTSMLFWWFFRITWKT